MLLKNLYRAALLGGCALAITPVACAEDCAALLVPDMALAQRDVATDLAYLTVITAANFTLHKQNAESGFNPFARGNAHYGLDLPIANELLHAASSYDEFAAQRAAQYRAHHFSYGEAELVRYFTLTLPQARQEQIAHCANTDSAGVRVAKADRDYVELVVTPSAGASDVPLTKLAVAGATLEGAPPTRLKAPASLRLRRDLDKELRFSALVGTHAVSLLVPRYLPDPDEVAPIATKCASAAEVVRAVHRQVLDSGVDAATLASESATLTGHRNNVRQLVKRLVNSDAFAKSVSGQVDETVVGALYRHVLARDGDPEGLAYNARLLHGADFRKVAAVFAESREYQMRFGEWIVPGRAPTIAYCPKN